MRLQAAPLPVAPCAQEPGPELAPTTTTGATATLSAPTTSTAHIAITVRLNAINELNKKIKKSPPHARAIEASALQLHPELLAFAHQDHQPAPTNQRSPPPPAATRVQHQHHFAHNIMATTTTC
ncbi:uncharacterized protein H6S33_004156 [Morchella sextelata]|uniref:uncharacterized protein n=1 Tax=Morchella sextelata TaxID=1174677 RepID=UPI001D03ADEE|nr:uncharacterized protein H6S33_004156 [Morchella sextelata]KAH0605699.1 hypothetical protein H6S33_004156 [Morchella sextelata]